MNRLKVTLIAEVDGGEPSGFILEIPDTVPAEMLERVTQQQLDYFFDSAKKDIEKEVSDGILAAR